MRLLIPGSDAFKAPRAAAARILEWTRRCRVRRSAFQTPKWHKAWPCGILATGGNEEEQAMSAMFVHFTLFDLFIGAALVGILCCGLVNSRTS